MNPAKARPAIQCANRFVFLGDGENITCEYRYDELDELVRVAAAFFQHGCGVTPGDHVMLALAEPHHFAVAFLGLQLIGAVPIGLPPNLNRFSDGERLVAIARESQAKHILLDNDRLDHCSVKEVRDRAAVVPIAIGEAYEVGYPEPNETHWPVAFVQYTSGSTYAPKGVVVSQVAFKAQVDLLVRAFGFDVNSVFINWLPLHHDMGLVSKVLLPYHLGATTVHMLPSSFGRKPVRWLRAIDTFRGTVSSAPNMAYDLCTRLPDEDIAGLDLSSWRHAVCGAEAVRAGTLEGFTARFAGSGLNEQSLYPAYGMAEAVLLITAHRGVVRDDASARDHILGDSLNGAMASCGSSPPEGTRLRVVDPQSGHECKQGSIGEIWLSGDSLASGYLQDGKLDSTSFEHQLFGDDEHVYFATGDYGYKGTNGLYVLGRLSSAITLAGRKYFFSDMEYVAAKADSRLPTDAAAAFSIDGGLSVILVIETRGAKVEKAELESMALSCAHAVEASAPVVVSDVMLVTRPLPRTSSGKLQRHRARAMYTEGTLKGRRINLSEAAASSTVGISVRDKALSLLCTALGMEPSKLDLDRTLPELGAESLAIVRVQTDIERYFRCVLDRTHLYTTMKMGELLDEVERCVLAGISTAAGNDPAAGVLGDSSRGSSFLESDNTEAAPSTHYQRAIYFAEQVAGVALYTLERAVRVEGNLRLDALEHCFEELQRRHDVLRGRLILDNQTLMFSMCAGNDVPLIVESLNKDGSPTDVQSALHKWSARGIQSVDERLYRVVVISVDDSSSWLLLQVHHSIADFWSLSILWRELLILYEANINGLMQHCTLQRPSYLDYCREQEHSLRADRLQRMSDYWRGTLSSRCNPCLPLTHDALRDYRAARRTVQLDAVTTDRIRTLAAHIGVTVNVLIQLAVQLTLAVTTRRSCVRYGVAFLNRGVQQRDMMGTFANLLPIEREVQSGESIDSALQAIHDALASGMAHEDCPLSLLGPDIVTQGSDRGTAFDMIYAYFDLSDAENQQGYSDIVLEREGRRVPCGDVELSPLGLQPNFAHYPLQLQVFSSDQTLEMRLECREALFDDQFVSSWLEQLRFSIATISMGSSSTCNDALVLSPELLEKSRHWGSAKVPRCDSVMASILATAEAYPGRDALIDASNGERWTYQHLIDVSIAIAERIEQTSSGTQPIVALDLPRSPLGVASCFGVLLAGGIYLPLDPDAPAERREYMLSNSGASVVLTNQLGEKRHLGRSVILVDKVVPRAARRQWPTKNMKSAAYLLYTSGSTGQPKGVLVSHAALDNRVSWMIDHLDLVHSDVFVQKTVWTFDVSLWEILAPLTIGATTVCLAQGEERYPENVATAFVKYQVSVAHFVPSVLLHWLGGAQTRDALGALRIGVCSGERMLRSLADAFFNWAPKTRLFNYYGPTEAAIDVTCLELFAGESAPVTIGKVAPGCEVSIADASGAAVLPGVAGELVIGGSQVAIGYLGQPALTASQFVPSPLGLAGRCYRTGDLARFNNTGEIVYLGRADRQVKLAGNRIELGEIEHVLSMHEWIDDAVVLVWDDELDEHCLCTFLMSDANDKLVVAAARKHAKQWLPSAMVPRVWRVLSHFPLLSNGKTDHAQLRQLLTPVDQPKVEAKSEDVKQLVRQVWSKALSCEALSSDADFFEQGGDSIVALVFIGKLRSHGITLTVHELFQLRTLGGIVNYVESRQTTLASDDLVRPFDLIDKELVGPLVAKGIEDAYPLSYLQRGILYKYFNDTHYRVLVTSFEIVAQWSESAMRESIDIVLGRHAFLRTSIDIEHYSEPLQLVHEQIEAPFTVIDLRANSLEGARADVCAHLQQESTRLFVWSEAPHCRFAVHILAKDRFQLTFCDAALDGWCVATVLTEVLNQYALAESQIGEFKYESGVNPLSYRDFVSLEQGALGSTTQQRYWRAFLDQHRLSVPTRSILSAGAAHNRLHWKGSARLVSDLGAAARRSGVPLKSVLMAAYIATLADVRTEPRVVTGVEFNGRPEREGGERCVGVFNNMLPIVVDTTGMSWLDLLRSCFDAESDILPYRRFPFAELVRLNGNSALFDTLFVYTHFHIYQELEKLPLRIVNHQTFDQTYIPITLHFNRTPVDDRLEILLDYDARVVSKFEAERLLSKAEQALKALAASDLDLSAAPQPAMASE